MTRNSVIAMRLLLVVALFPSAPQVASGQTVSAATVKAAFLYNFAKFAGWPAAVLTPGQRIALCVVGDIAVADALDQTIRGRIVEGHELSVQVLNADDQIRSCHLLYVDGHDRARAAQLIEALKSSPVLSVSDAAGFAERGGVAQLILEGDRMRFAINPTAADRVRVKLSSKLLGLAAIVKETR